MKPSFLLCFLVLVISYDSRGQTTTVPPGGQVEKKEIPSVDRELNKTAVPPKNEGHNGSKNESETPKPAATQELLNGSRNDTTSPTAPTPSKPTSQKAPSVSMTQGGKEKESGSKDNEEVTSAATTITAGLPPHPSSKAGYVILVFIIIVIIILCIILYMLRRASRSYSFDLQRPAPSSHLDEPIGTFEQVYLDDLDRPVPKDIIPTEDLSTPPVANGTSPPLKEKETSEEQGNEASQEQPEANGLQNSPSISASTSSNDDQPEEVSNQLSSNNNLFFDAVEEKQQNENNNNPSVSYSHPFVEINLDEPERCDQFLTSPQPTSSVYPFSSSSFSSSS